MIDRFRQELTRLMQTPDEQTIHDFSAVIQSIQVPEKMRSILDALIYDDFTFVHDLHGENGSPRLLVDLRTQQQAVMKTYEPVADLSNDHMNEGADRLDQLKEEAAAFLVALETNLVQVPPTALRLLTEDTFQKWNVRKTYDSSAPSRAGQVVMMQTFIPEAEPFDPAHQALPELVKPQQIFALLIFDYLIAYGDGRAKNLLLAPDHTLLPIDHGKSFRSKNVFLGTNTLGISPDFMITKEEIDFLFQYVNTERMNILIGNLLKLLGKQRTTLFAKRLDVIQHLLSTSSSLSVSSLKQAVGRS